MENLKGQEKVNRRHKNNRNFVLAIVAVLMFAVLLAVSIYFAASLPGETDESNEQNQLHEQTKDSENQIFSAINRAIPTLRTFSLNEISKIEEQNRKLQEEAKKQEELLKALGEAEDEEPEPDEPEIEYTGVVYLTFDDGPSRAVTTGILDLLAEEGILATFFVINRVDVEDLYERIIAEGHEMANHSFNHNYNRLYSRGIEAFKEDILRLHNYILEDYGYEMTTFRFPGGSKSWNQNRIAERREVLSELGYIDFDWHIDSKDAAPAGVDTSAATLTRNVLSGIGDREHVIVLMHDYRYRQSTLEALPAIIEHFRELGYRFDVMKNYPVDD